MRFKLKCEWVRSHKDLGGYNSEKETTSAKISLKACMVDGSYLTEHKRRQI